MTWEGQHEWSAALATHARLALDPRTGATILTPCTCPAITTDDVLDAVDALSPERVPA